jgi:hypothetical protein
MFSYQFFSLYLLHILLLALLVNVIGFKFPNFSIRNPSKLIPSHSSLLPNANKGKSAIVVGIVVDVSFSFHCFHIDTRLSFSRKQLYPSATVSPSTSSYASISPSHGIIPDGGISPCVIKVVGVGGGGGNAIMRMIETGVQGEKALFLFWTCFLTLLFHVPCSLISSRLNLY